jgi:hypothetical protein
MLKNRLHDWLLRARTRIFLVLTAKGTVYNVPVWVTNFRRDTTEDHLFDQIEAALSLIAEYQPRRLHRMLQDVERIWVRQHTLCRAAFWPESRSCILDTFFVATFPPEQIAASIIHEAIHARVHAFCGPGYLERRTREEALCRKAEIQFGLAIPNGEAIVMRAHEARVAELSEDAIPIDWAEAYRRAALAEIEQLSAPRWIKRWMARKRGLHNVAPAPSEQAEPSPPAPNSGSA